MAERLRLPDWFKEASASSCPAGDGGGGTGFIERNLRGFSSVMLRLFSSEEKASQPGLLQGLEARARVAGIFLLIISSAVSRTTVLLLSLLVLTYALALLSSVGPLALFKRALPAFVFTSVLALPTVFMAADWAGGGRGAGGWGFSIASFRMTATMEGIATWLFFVLRVTVMVSLTSLLLLTTRQADLFRALRAMKLPAFFVTALFMTFRYIFILLKTAEDSTLARKSRAIRRVTLRESEGWFASRVAFLLKKSLSMAEDVHLAIVSRGFTGAFRSLAAGRIGAGDYAWLGVSSFFLLLSLGF